MSRAFGYLIAKSNLVRMGILRDWQSLIISVDYVSCCWVNPIQGISTLGLGSSHSCIFPRAYEQGMVKDLVPHTHTHTHSMHWPEYETQPVHGAGCNLQSPGNRKGIMTPRGGAANIFCSAEGSAPRYNSALCKLRSEGTTILLY